MTSVDVANFSFGVCALLRSSIYNSGITVLRACECTDLRILQAYLLLNPSLLYLLQRSMLRRTLSRPSWTRRPACWVAYRPRSRRDWGRRCLNTSPTSPGPQTRRSRSQRNYRRESRCSSNWQVVVYVSLAGLYKGLCKVIFFPKIQNKTG